MPSSCSSTSSFQSEGESVSSPRSVCSVSSGSSVEEIASDTLDGVQLSSKDWVSDENGVPFEAETIFVDNNDGFVSWFGVKETVIDPHVDKCEGVFPRGVPPAQFRCARFNSVIEIPAVPKGVSECIFGQSPKGIPKVPPIKLTELPPVVPSTLESVRPVVGPQVKSSKLDLSELHGLTFGVKAPLHQTLPDDLSKEQHFLLGQGISSPFDHAVSLPKYIEEVLAIHESWDPYHIHQFRVAMLDHIGQYVRSPEHQSVKHLWQASRPPHAKRINPQFDGPLFQYLLRLAGGNPDLWGEHLRLGFPLSGDMGNYGVWNRPVSHPVQEMSVSNLTSTAKDRFASVVENVRKQSAEQIDGVWKASDKEHKAKFIRGPFWVDRSRGDGFPSIFDEFDSLTWEDCNFLPRKGVPHNKEENAIRPIDDGRFGAINLCVRLLSMAFLPTLEQYATIIARLISLKRGAIAFKGDHDKAYKRWPAAEKDILLTFLVIMMKVGEEGENSSEQFIPAIFAHESLCFGCLGSVFSYCPLSLQLVLILSRCFATIMLAYVDDLLGADQEGPLSGSAFFCFLQLHSWLGVLLKASKQQCPVAALAALGMRVLLCNTAVMVAPSSARRVKVSAALQKFIDNRLIPRKDAKVAAGQCSFLAGGLWGRVGRVALHCLWSFTAWGSNRTVDDKHVAALRVLQKLVECCKPRAIETISLKPRRKAFAWIDGSWNPSKGEGGIGVILVVLGENGTPAGKWVAACGVPVELRARWDALKSPKHLVSQVEAVAASVLLSTFESELAGCSLIVFEDNRGAQSALLRGASKSVLSAELALAFWWLAAKGDVIPWLERVNSASNIADGPSRGDLELAFKMGCLWRDPIWPEWLLYGTSALLIDIETHSDSIPQ